MAYELTLIGGGVAGVLTAINALRQYPNMRVAIIEMQTNLGLGIAYSAQNDYHLLNVAAGSMSAFPNQATHFYDWLCENGYKYRSEDFVPRRIYGLYIQNLCKQFLYPCPHFSHIQQEAINMNTLGAEFGIVLKNGETLRSRQVVLATGNVFYKELPIFAGVKANHYHDKPWTESFLAHIKPQEDVLILGTGLTMVDTVVSLFKKRHKGQIYAISRNGYVPFPHYKPSIKYPNYSQEVLVAANLREVVELVRAHCEKALLRNIPVGAVIDVIRPHIQTFWQKASLQEKRWFSKEMAALWSVVRHRVPQRYSNLLMDLHFQRRQFEAMAGEVEGLEVAENGTYKVAVLEKQHHTHQHIHCQHIINCIGFDFDLEKHPHSLLTQLAHKGIIAKDELGMGIHIDENLNIIDLQGETQKNLYAIGSLLKGTLFETTALREIREQAAFISQQLAVSSEQS